MNTDEYMAEVRRLGLRPTNVPTVYRDVSDNCVNVPPPEKYTNEERAKIIRQMKRIMGVST